MYLNLGHTFGHGLEHAGGYGKLLHGEAVLLGLWAAVRLSLLLKPSREKRLDAYRALVESFLSRIPRMKIDPDRVLTAMSYDKKRHGREVRFVLLDRPGKPFIADNVPGRLLRDALRRTLAAYDRLGGKDA
jgi:3-dehydroquinate synthetase